jgi:hypothetical protein
MKYSIVLIAAAGVLAGQGHAVAKGGAPKDSVAQQVSAGSLLAPCTVWAQKKGLSNKLTRSERDRCVAAGGPDKVK